MYVDDIDDLAELEELQANAQARLDADPDDEQASWDLEDIEQRISQVSGE